MTARERRARRARAARRRQRLVSGLSGRAAANTAGIQLLGLVFEALGLVSPAPPPPAPAPPERKVRDLGEADVL